MDMAVDDHGVTSLWRWMLVPPAGAAPLLQVRARGGRILHVMITLATDFPGGSAEQLRTEDLGRGREQVRFAARKGGGPVSMWWHFALRSDAAQTVHCVWEDTATVLGHPGLAAAVPVYDDGGGWRRVPARSCRYLGERGELHFGVPCRAGETRVAYCFPYTEERVRSFVAQLVGTGLATVRELGRSEHGRAFELLEFGGGPFEVWVTAAPPLGRDAGRLRAGGAGARGPAPAGVAAGRYLPCGPHDGR